MSGSLHSNSNSVHRLSKRNPYNFQIQTESTGDFSPSYFFVLKDQNGHPKSQLHLALVQYTFFFLSHKITDMENSTKVIDHLCQCVCD